MKLKWSPCLSKVVFGPGSILLPGATAGAINEDTSSMKRVYDSSKRTRGIWRRNGQELDGMMEQIDEKLQGFPGPRD